MIVNQPNTAALNKLKTTLKRFFSLIAWNVPTTAKIATRPKITINKFIKKTLLSTSENECRKQYSYFIVNVLQVFVEEKNG